MSFFNSVENDLSAGTFSRGIAINNRDVGVIELKNITNSPLVIAESTVLAIENGLTFSFPSKVIVAPNQLVSTSIQASGTPVNTGSFSKLITSNSVSNLNQYKLNFNVLNGCETHIAIVVDESGSINQIEANQIKNGLTSFINLQSSNNNNVVLSLVGMSQGDLDTRTDHVSPKHIFNNQQEFTNWIEVFGSRGINVQSDYWASGLEFVDDFMTTPDVVVIVTDGLQVNNTAILQERFSSLNQKSHVFVYGVSGGDYLSNAMDELVLPLNFYLDRAAVLKTSFGTMLDTDYIVFPDFDSLGNELNQLATDLATAQVGCFSNVKIIENKLDYPVLNSGVAIHKQAGSLVLKNSSRVPLRLEQGTLIHDIDATLSGMVFTLRDTVSIGANAQLEVFVLVDGTPVHSGNFSALMLIENSTNPNSFVINFTVGKDFSTVDINENSVFQSPSLSLLAAGSQGYDSTKGIHLRWLFTGALGENHLPKGDLFTGISFGYNKPDDFVKLYRSPYVKTTETTTTIQLHSAPTLVDNSNALWIYKDAKQRLFYVYFKNKSKYASIIQDPISNPVDFLQAYGNELIEIENNNELFFAADLRFSSEVNYGTVRLESLSVAENTIKAAKTVSSRKTHNWTPSSPIRVVAENGRGIRFRANDCIINEIDFELYSDFIEQANENETWVSKGKYSLTLDDLQAFKQLEPKFGSVHGKWLKYHEEAYVNTKNYRDKWGGSVAEGERNIKNVVEKYLEKSNDSSTKNPKAIEYISLGNDNSTDEEKVEISNLDLLNIAANDYHIARMLGLGVLDIDEAVFTGNYIYLTKYTTHDYLNSETEAVVTEHIAMSIPVSIDKERLSLPIELDRIVPGLNLDSISDEPKQVTADDNGYGFDGKKRYLSLFMKDVLELGYKVPFFDTPLEYDASSFTFPVYAGVEYKIDSENYWRKPGITYDFDYYNVNNKLAVSLNSNEPLPIIIPEAQKPLLNLRQEEIGSHIYWYQGYGVNLFSRATSGNTINIKSDIIPKNTLVAPSAVNPLVVVKENPLMFTSQNEQSRYDLIESDDKTYIRVLLDYYSVQELQTYSIPQEMSLDEAKDQDAIFKDNDEIYAEDIELFFRDSLPLVALGKITDVVDGEATEIIWVITVEGYTLVSTGEVVPLIINQANALRFIGGVLTIENENYIIQEVEVIQHINEATGEVVVDKIKAQVLKKEVTASILSDGNATVDSDQLQGIKIPNNGLCSLVENMLTTTNWNPAGPMDFKVAIPEVLSSVNREILQIIDQEGNIDNTLEKTRGIWETANITIVEEDAYEKDADDNYVLIDDEPVLLSKPKHLGLYKITFPNYSLDKHPSDNGNAIENSVEWANGIVRLFTESSLLSGITNPIKSRKEFRVVRTENIGTTSDLVLYIKDTDFKLEGNGSTYVVDPEYDKIITGIQKVNYYPSYRVYLFKNQAYGITEEAIQPREGESTHYSIVGARAHAFKFGEHHYSKISVPSPMHTVAVIEPIKPVGLKNHSGSMYATRPDFFKRSTYTFVTEYDQKPHGVLHYRANDEALLSVLYEQDTILQIREELNKRGGKNEKSSNARWQNFLNFEELEARGVYQSFQDLDSTEESYSFPMPDNEDLLKAINYFIDWHNATLNLQEPKIPENSPLQSLNQVIVSQGVENELLAIYFIEQVIHAVFVPLTELPVIYDLIDINRSPDYVPSAKKQTIKDKNGHILKATDPDFDMAPMMKIVTPVATIPPTETIAAVTQFTDFNIDGTSNNLYFYGVREMDIKMNIGSFSPFLGPIKLVNTNPPQAPEIKRIMPVLENPVLGINPAIQIEINAYHKEHNIKKINVYRASTMFDARSIRTMLLVKEILVDESILASDFDNVWVVYDEFEDVENIPFGEALFYRITTSREIEYDEYDYDTQANVKVIDYAPSQPSKIIATIIAENVSPESPVLQASGVLAGIDNALLESVVLHWEKTVHNGKYHLYKMNSQGNWEKIHEIISNENENQLALADTQWGTDSLTIKTEDGDKIYHHFKLIAENSSGMYSYEEKILSLYNENLIVI